MAARSRIAPEEEERNEFAALARVIAGLEIDRYGVVDDELAALARVIARLEMVVVFSGGQEADDDGDGLARAQGRALAQAVVEAAAVAEAADAWLGDAEADCMDRISAALARAVLAWREGKARREGKSLDGPAPSR